MNIEKLWYTKEASEWTQALPLGNGHMGAMCYGDTGRFQGAAPGMVFRI